jgi:hypothetical protein
MTAEEAALATRGLTFEKVWEMFEETDRRIEESSRKTDRAIRRLSKNIGGLNNSFGKWAEAMVSAKLWEKFKTLGYTFTHGGPHEFWEGERTVAQVDMLLENGDYLMAVEIKSALTEENVDDHLKRVEKVREYLDKRGDRRKLVGAVAGMVVSAAARDYAQKKGLYVLVQSGKSVALAETPAGFTPREWQAAAGK